MVKYPEKIGRSLRRKAIYGCKGNEGRENGELEMNETDCRAAIKNIESFRRNRDLTAYELQALEALYETLDFLTVN